MRLLPVRLIKSVEDAPSEGLSPKYVEVTKVYYYAIRETSCLLGDCGFGERQWPLKFRNLTRTRGTS